MMRNPNQERLRRLMKQYHRHHPWRLKNGLFISSAYTEPQQLSWWDDVGFILNKRRVMVWWEHPRMQYADAIKNLAWNEAGEPPLRGDALFDSSQKEWKKVGRSRKKVVAYRTSFTPAVQRNFYEKLRAIEARIQSEGIDLVVRPSMTVNTLSWCTGIDLCVPIEVRNKEEVTALAALARRLIKRETNIADEFQDYQYGKADWLTEADQRTLDRESRIAMAE
jgi:hypothetical protein